MAATSLLPINHVYDGIYFNPLCFPCEHLKKVKEFEFFEDDVLVATYPKAGQSNTMHVMGFLFIYFSLIAHNKN